MEKLEISFSARRPYNSDDEHLNRNTNMEFDAVDVETVVREFNKFLVLNDYDAKVVLNG